jgi:hypothetical protein
MTTIQASLVAIVGSVGSIVVGFGILNSTTEGVIVSAVGTIISSVVAIINQSERNTQAKVSQK